MYNKPHLHSCAIIIKSHLYSIPEPNAQTHTKIFIIRKWHHQCRSLVYISFLMIILFHPFTLFLLYFIVSVFMFYALRSFWLLFLKKKKKNVIVALQLNFELCKLKTKKNKKRRSEVRDFRIEQIIPNSWHVL